MDIVHKEIKFDELHDDMLSGFRRYQEVIHDWNPREDGGYEFVLEPHIEDWDENAKKDKVKKMIALLENGGRVFGAFDEGKLIGFSAINGVLFGAERQYLELAELRVCQRAHLIFA